MLAIAQRIHRINHNRPNAFLLIASRARFQNPIHDRNDVTQRFTGARARRNDKAAATAGNFNGVALVAVQLEFLTRPVVFAPAEDSAAFRMEKPCVHQFADGPAAHKAWIQLDEW